MKKVIIPGIFLLIIIGALWLGYFAADIFLSDRGAGENYQEFKIETGQGVNAISDNLKKAGLIGSKLNFETYVWLLRRENKLQVGSYQLKPSLSLRELVNMITYGWGTNERKLTIIEGWTNKQIEDYLIANFFIYYQGRPEEVSQYQRDFVRAAATSFDTWWLKDKPESLNLEGYLFPDTYNFYTDANAWDVVNKLIANFDVKVGQNPAVKEKLASSGHTFHEIITMASIIEKEVQTDQDRRLVADIFWRRVAIGMPLQADSTVNYVTGKSDPAVSATDKQIDSPYNTYKNKGLPPGPICNPGLSAIEAALNPVKNDNWYFLTTKDGAVIYSRTLDEHNEAKAKYLK